MTFLYKLMIIRALFIFEWSREVVGSRQSLSWRSEGLELETK